MSVSGASPGRVLVMDPDDVNARMISALLSDAGHDVLVVGTKLELITVALRSGAGAILMEADCRDGDGFDICATLRARGYRGPVIFVTARHEVGDKIRAFDSGADDYVVKPFDARELLARVAAVCRRFRDAQQLALGRDVRVGDATLSPGTGTFRIDGSPRTYLSPTEVRVLECLMRDSGVAISRDGLLERAWPHSFVGDNSRVDVVVARIRKKIERDPSAPKYLLTVRGVGYTFRPALRPHLALEPAAEGAAEPASLPGA
jgi:two-component system response regulator RegX3